MGAGRLRRSQRRQNWQAVPSNGTVCHSRGRNLGQKYLCSIGRTAAQEFSFRFTGSTVRGGPSDRLRRIESPFCPEQVRAFLRVAGMADVAGNLSLEIAGDGEEDSSTDGLDDRAFLPTRHRADDRFAAGETLNAGLTPFIDCADGGSGEESGLA